MLFKSLYEKSISSNPLKKGSRWSVLLGWSKSCVVFVKSIQIKQGFNFLVAISSNQIGFLSKLLIVYQSEYTPISMVVWIGLYWFLLLILNHSENSYNNEWQTCNWCLPLDCNHKRCTRLYRLYAILNKSLIKVICLI